MFDNIDISNIKKWQESNPGHWRKNTKETEHIPGHYLSPTEVMRWKIDGPEARDLEKLYEKVTDPQMHMFIIGLITYRLGRYEDVPLSVFLENEAGI